MGLIGCAVWPTSVARALAAESHKTVKKQFTWASLSFTIRFLVPYFWGICAFVFIYTQSDALKHLFVAEEGAKPLLNGLYAMPVFLGQILPPVVIGIISAGMIAAFMSTHDSYLLCWSSVLTEDVVAPICNDRVGPTVRIWLTRLFIVLIGTVGGFACMAVWVTIGGVGDIKRLFARINAEHEKEERQQPESE